MSTEKLCGASIELAEGKNSLTPKYTVKHFLHAQKFPLKFCWVKESKKYIPENSTSDSVIALLDRCFVRSYTTVLRVIYEIISKDYFYTPNYHPMSTAFIHTIQYKKYVTCKCRLSFMIILDLLTVQQLFTLNYV